MNTDRIDLEEAQQLVEWVRGQRVGTMEVLDARAWLDAGAGGEPLTMFELIVSDPPGKYWVYEDLAELRRRMWEKANEIGIMRWHAVRLTRDEAAARDAALAAMR